MLIGIGVWSEHDNRILALQGRQANIFHQMNERLCMHSCKLCMRRLPAGDSLTALCKRGQDQGLGSSTEERSQALPQILQ